ncbi:hypothetical protein AQUCO_03400042v1 [Aquilegia coerulea]|uniref:Uncharacterized protein n=1 Tax=Aquilegia coerulea TaxID=218851 RepID=A0A2G5CX78_AQUCA|nr:hypothetical protein AQUCO_03400042v1 [Aquilegia coerulea]
MTINVYQCSKKSQSYSQNYSLMSMEKITTRISNFHPSISPFIPSNKSSSRRVEINNTLHNFYLCIKTLHVMSSFF